MAKRIEFTVIGGPEVFKYVNYNLQNEQPSSNEIRIEHISIGVNYIDTYHRSGLYPVTLPLVPGLEAVGKIIDVGVDVVDFSIGERVGYCSPPLGSYCEIRDYPADKAFKIPDFINSDEAASILLKGMTVEYLFNRTYKIKPNDIFIYKRKKIWNKENIL